MIPVKCIILKYEELMKVFAFGFATGEDFETCLDFLPLFICGARLGFSLVCVFLIRCICSQVRKWHISPPAELKILFCNCNDCKDWYLLNGRVYHIPRCEVFL